MKKENHLIQEREKGKEYWEIKKNAELCPEISLNM